MKNRNKRVFTTTISYSMDKNHEEKFCSILKEGVFIEKLGMKVKGKQLIHLALVELTDSLNINSSNIETEVKKNDNNKEKKPEIDSFFSN